MLDYLTPTRSNKVNPDFVMTAFENSFEPGGDYLDALYAENCLLVMQIMEVTNRAWYNYLCLSKCIQQGDKELGMAVLGNVSTCDTLAIAVLTDVPTLRDNMQAVVLALRKAVLYSMM